jgi:hypothetical protein
MLSLQGRGHVAIAVTSLGAVTSGTVTPLPAVLGPISLWAGGCLTLFVLVRPRGGIFFALRDRSDRHAALQVRLGSRPESLWDCPDPCLASRVGGDRGPQHFCVWQRTAVAVCRGRLSAGFLARPIPPHFPCASKKTGGLPGWGATVSALQVMNSPPPKPSTLRARQHKPYFTLILSSFTAFAAQMLC